MEDYSNAIEKLVAEHEQTMVKLQKYDKDIANCLASLKQSWIPGRPMGIEEELGKLDQYLEEIRTDLEEHIRVEEKEVLPTLTKYSANIISKAVLYEHEKILKSISELEKHAGDLVNKTTNRSELLNGEFKIKEAINQILQLIQEHSDAQEVIYNLAQEALDEDLNKDD